MGLETVEIVLEVEERFGIDLPDSQCAQVYTVADLAAITIQRILHNQVGACTTASGFYRLRRTLIASGIPRERVLPKTSLIDLLPSRRVRRRVWREARSQLHSLPRLQISPRLDELFLAIAIIGPVMLIGVFVLVKLTLGVGAALAAGFVLLFAGLAAGSALIGLAQTQFAPSISTVGDAARIGLSKAQVETDRPGAHVLITLSVLEQLRAMISDVLGIPVEKVKPESRFVEDLGCG